jgi:hypothetical protein
MREISGRLEEIPGEEAFPAYLESRIAGFYERAGVIQLRDGRKASVTIGGTVSPAGGNFDEPVTQATLKVVGAFHGLSRDRSDARRYPAIDPLESWSKYTGIIEQKKVERVRSLLQRGDEVRQMMTVVGEEGTPIEDFSLMLKSEFFDSSYLQQNAFDDVDGSSLSERQRFVFDKVLELLNLDFGFEEKDEARSTLLRIGNLFKDWNYAPWDPSVIDSLEGEQSMSEGDKDKKEDKTADRPEHLRSEGGRISKRDKIDKRKEQEKKEKEESRGDFKKILEEIDDFLKTKGGRVGGKEKEDARKSHSRYLAQKAKTVKTNARPRSRRTLSGRTEDEENAQHAKEEEKR